MRAWLIRGSGLLTAAAFALGAGAAAAQTAPGGQQKIPASPQKAAQVAAAPVSDIIQRIQTEQARLDMAQNLARLAATPDELRLAQKAVRLADHELGLAFLIGLRRAADNPTPKEARALADHVASLEDAVSQQQAVVDGLKRKLATAHGRRKKTFSEQLELEQAKLDLANDELGTAREDLVTAGGDLKTQIERLQAEHDAAEQRASAAGSAPAQTGPVQTADTLLANLQAWFQLRGVHGQIDGAFEDAAGAVDTARQRESDLEKEAGAASGAAPPTGGSAPSSVDNLRLQSRLEKIRASYKLRIRDLAELASTYQKWSDLVAARQKTAGRAILRGILWIVLFLLVGFITNRIVQRIVGRVTDERRRLHTLRTVSRFAVQAVTLGLILLVVLGPPSQLATLVAFAGAGLTVALKDFIVSFVGWFMLMGRNGVHVGDWVEINGVCGEVIEVSLFHTVLLETGNWTDPGHPTGRKVTFTNAYAIEGHYFNFSTSGQWLWDELQVQIPAGENSNALAGALLNMVAAETQPSRELAEQELQKLSAGVEGAHPVSAAPVVMVQPSGGGITARVRYITRANERFELRARLYQRTVDLLQGRQSPAVSEAKV